MALCGIAPIAAAQGGPTAVGVASDTSDWRAPPGQQCNPAELPARLPDVAQLIDTLGLRAYVLQVGLADSLVPATLAVAEYGPSGAVTQVRLLDAAVADSTRAGLAQALAAALADQPPTPAAWTARIYLPARLHGSPSVARSEVCPPARTKPRNDVRGAGRPMSLTGGEMARETHELRWRAVIDREGSVRTLDLLSKLPTLDASTEELLRNIADELRGERWLPGLVDRERTIMAAEFTTRLRIRTFR